MKPNRHAAAALLAAASALAQAADDDIDAALELADATTTEAEAPARDWKLDLEGALIQTDGRGTDDRLRSRLSLDFRLDTRLTPTLRAVFADRLDAYDPYRLRGRGTTNVLKEAYLAWQPAAGWLFDLGRVNLRVGSAYAYNPSDFFRGDAIRSLTSADPDSKRDNRMGTVMLRGQVLGDNGSVSLLVAPKLARERSTAPFSPDLAATNGGTRWQLASSYRLSPNLSPQFIVYGDDDTPPQFGLNMTAVFGRSVVGHAEWVGGRIASQLSRASGGDEDVAFRARGAAGLTWTLPINLVLTAEYQYDGAAVKRDAWRGLPAQSPQRFGQYLQWVNDQQELATPNAAFLRARWQDAIWRRLDLTGFVQVNLDDDSRLTWFEARRRFDRFDVALQFQRNGGGPTTQYGALPQRHVWQLLLEYYL